MQDPFTKVSRRLQVIQENHKFDLSSGLCLVHHLSAMEPPCSSTYHIPDDLYLLEYLTNTAFLNNRIPPLVVTEYHSGIHHVYKLLTRELQQPDYLTEGHTINNVFCLGVA